MRNVRLLAAALMLFLVLMPPMTVRAAEETGSVGEQPVGIAFKWVHFAIVAGLLIYVARIYGRAHFYRQADVISAAISKASAAKAEAERQLQHASDRLAKLDQEIAEFRSNARREARAEFERLRTIMRTDAEKIGAAAEAEIKAAERAARVELKRLAAKLAVDRAQHLVSQQMNAAVHESLIHNFVATLEGRPN